MLGPSIVMFATPAAMIYAVRSHTVVPSRWTVAALMVAALQNLFLVWLFFRPSMTI